MDTTDLTLEILKGIRDEGRKTNERLEQFMSETKSGLTELRGELRSGLTELREELSHRIVDSEVRTATAITDLSGTVRDLVTLLRSNNDLRPRLERCEQDIAALKEQIHDA